MRRLKLPRWLKIIIGIYLAYLALVLLVATPLLNVFAPKIYREQTGAELQLDKIIRLNPFTLSASIKQARSANADGTPFWSFDEFEADVALASLWRGHLALDALALRGLTVQIAQTAPGRFNFNDILDYRAKRFPAEPAPAPDSAASEPFAIDIAQLDITAKQLGFRAPHAAEPIDARLGELSFALTNFSSAPEKTEAKPAMPAAAMPALRAANLALAIKTLGVDFMREQHPFAAQLRDFTLALRAPDTARPFAYEFSVLDAGGGRAQITGNADLAQHSAAGRAQLRALSLVPVSQYLAGKLAFEAQRALLDGDIHFRGNWGEPLAYQVMDSQLALRDAQLQSRVDADTSAAFNALRVEGIAVDSTQPQVHIARVALEQPVLRGWNRETEVSLLDMIYFPTSEEQEEAPPWRVLIENIEVADGRVHWRASQLDNRRLTVAPLAIQAANLHWPEPAPLRFKATAAIREDAAGSAGKNGATAVEEAIAIEFDGDLVPGDVTGSVNGTVANLPLAWGNTYLRQQMLATIAHGALSARFAVKLDKAQPVAVQSDGAIEQFELQMLPPSQRSLTDRRKLASWKKLEWQQLALAPAQQKLDIKRVVVTQPWAQFRINADGTNNFQQLMVSSTATAQTDAASAPAETRKAQQTMNSRLRSSDESGSRKNPSTEKPWQFAVDTIHIDRANIDFRDASLVSAFRTNITDLSGNITGLTNASNSAAAKVGLKGTVDGYAPVALTGTVNPFAATPALNITLDMTNLDLAALTPYAGTYAGYRIDGGRLSVQLAYTLENNRIKGSNHIVVNQLQLGEQVSGPKVMDLPLRLAIYLLTDANGVMDLGVDVTGNVDDPDFSVGSIIWKAFRNLIVKTVASPFRALAGLIGGGSEDLDRIEFVAGSSQLADGESGKLQAVNKAMQQKPALQLLLTGHVSPIRDLEALRDHALSAELIALDGIAPTDIQQQSKSWQRAVTKLFKQRFPDEKIEQWQVMQMNDAMRDNLELPPAALQELAAQRALAIKQTLVTDFGLAADRAFVKPADLGADKDPGPYVTLAVE